QLQQVFVEVPEGALLDRAAGLAKCLPVGQLADGGLTLGADGLGGLAHVAAELGVGQREPRGVLEPDGPCRRNRLHVPVHQLRAVGGTAPAHGGAPPRAVAPPWVEASPSARWTAPPPARWGCKAPPMCIRHELSDATQYSAPVSRTHRSLSPSMAI